MRWCGSYKVRLCGSRGAVAGAGAGSGAGAGAEEEEEKEKEKKAIIKIIFPREV